MDPSVRTVVALALLACASSACSASIDDAVGGAAANHGGGQTVTTHANDGGATYVDGGTRSMANDAGVAIPLTSTQAPRSIATAGSRVDSMDAGMDSAIEQPDAPSVIGIDANPVDASQPPPVDAGTSVGKPMWVVTGYDLRRISSPDTVTWSHDVSSPNGGETIGRGLAYGNGMFAIASDSGLLTSTDGATWTIVQGVPGLLASVAYGNGKFVVIAQGDSWTSSDGVTFTQSPTTSFFATHWKLAFGGGHFLAMGTTTETARDARSPKTESRGTITSRSRARCRGMRSRTATGASLRSPTMADASRRPTA